VQGATCDGERSYKVSRHISCEYCPPSFFIGKCFDDGKTDIPTS
jgi:hypothetical protein